MLCKSTARVAGRPLVAAAKRVLRPRPAGRTTPAGNRHFGGIERARHILDPRGPVDVSSRRASLGILEIAGKSRGQAVAARSG
jgi:hypothetical protein